MAAARWPQAGANWGEQLTSETTASLPWNSAFAIHERQASIAGSELGKDGAARWEMWQTLPVFRQDHPSDDVRLAPLAVTAAELQVLLGEDTGIVTEEPGWHSAFRLYADERNFAGINAHAELGLAEVVRPLVNGALNEMRERLALTIICCDSRAKDFAQLVADAILRVPPVDELADIVTPTMVLEINVAREEQRLAGETAEERYSDFITKLHDRDFFLGLCSEYTVMARLCIERLTMWQDRMTELLEAVIADFERLRDKFWNGFVPDTANLVLGAGDSHNEGRSVIILETSIASVVFKPRNCKMDEGFAELLTWFNSKGPTLDLAGTGVIPSALHGWFEFIKPEPIPDLAAAARYSRRLGMLTALIYILRATDFHHENIMASGEHPIAVDLEALFHAERATAASKGKENLTLASQVLSTSVMSTGIVPNRIIRGSGSDLRAVDVSAAGAHGQQPGIVEVPSLQMRQTDKVHIVPAIPVFTATANAPSDSGGVSVSVVDYAEDFIAGFEEAYEIVLESRAELLLPGGLLDSFRGAESRLIARPTMTYAKLLLESFHPDFLRYGIDRDMCLSKLLGGYEGTTHRTSMLASEISDLRRGDIPAFFVSVESDIIRSGTERRPVGKVTAAPLAEVRRFLTQQAGASDLAQQLQVLRLAFEAARLADGEGMAFFGRPLRADSPAADDQQRLDCAVNIADKILDMAAERQGERGWIGLSFVGEKWWSVTPTGTDLYNGTSGIALALATVGAVAHNDRATEAALGLCEQLVGHSEEMLLMAERMTSTEKNGALDTGAFGALSGPIYALSHAAVRYGRTDFATAASALSTVVAAAAGKDQNFDIVSGNAGGILGQLSLYEATGEVQHLKLARDLAFRLKAGAIRAKHGVAWKPQFNSLPLVGLSHGASGVALSLSRLQAVDGIYDFDDLIAGALAYESGHYLPHSGDWEDLRDTEFGNSTVMRAWCHGSPGAALVRHELMKLSHGPQDPIQAEQLQASLVATRSTLIPTAEGHAGIGNHSLCHGDVGNLIAYEEGLKGLNEEIASAMSLGRQPWDRICQAGVTEGWLCGIPTAQYVPGLMTGLAGIAWGLAYSVAPDAEPNLMTLDSPHLLRPHGEA